MPIPSGVEKVVVSDAGVPLTLPDGTLMQGYFDITGPDLATVSGDDYIFGGSVRRQVTDGLFDPITLVATDATGVNPTGFTYTIRFYAQTGASWTRYLSLPQASATVNLADILIPDPAAPAYTVLADPTSLASSTVVTETGFGQASSAGSAGTFSRGDHTHGTPSLANSAPAATERIGTAAAVGTATTPARADHVHPMAVAGTPGTSEVGDTASTGTATTFAASDHRHGREAFGAVTPQTAFGAASSDGAASTVARSDHTHGTPTLPTATTSTAGVVQLDGTAADIQPLGSQAAGAIGKAADAGHVHAMPRLDQVSAPTANVSLNSQRITSLAAATTGTDALSRNAGDARYLQPSQVPAVTIVPAATGVQATDAANIAAAVTAAGTNGTVYFPSGTYVADQLAPLSGQTWYGPGTIQRPSGSANSVITATGLTGFRMRELTIDGNRSNATATSNAAIYLITPTNCRITDVTVQNTPATNAGIILRGAIRCTVDSCRLLTVGYGVLIGLNNGDAGTCYGNVIRGVTIDTTDWNAIFLTENLGSVQGPAVTGNVIGTVVSHCTVRGFGDCGIEVGSGSIDTTVSNCSFIGLSDGRGNNGVLFRDAQDSTVSDCTVSGLTKAGSTGVYCVNLNGTNKRISIENVVTRNTGYGCIAIGGTSGSSIGTACQDIEINGGIIDGTTLDGIHLSNVTGFGITGTKVRNAGQQGISLGKFNTSSVTDGTLTGVRVFNSGQAVTGQSGVIAFQNTADVALTGCRIGDNQGGGRTQAYGIRLFDSTVSSITVSNCDLTNGGTTSNFTSAPAMGSGIQVLNTIGFNPKGLTAVTAQPAASWEPSDHNLVTWSYDAALTATSTTIPTNGCLYLIGVYARTAFTTSTAYLSVPVTGSGATAGQNWIGLYNTSGVLCASKGIDSTVTAPIGLQTITWTSSYTGPAGMYWIGLLFNATTNPTLHRMSTPADNVTQNVGLSAPFYRMCQQGTGLTALPSPLTVASNSISNSPSTPRLFWAAIG